MIEPLLPRRRLAAVLVLAAVLTPAMASAAPTPRECATASEDALTLKKQERLGAAKERLLVCADPACPAEVREECGRRIPEVTAAMPSIVFEVKDAAGNDVSSVKVTMDGAPLLDHVGAAATPVDPGEHTFRFEAAGSPPIEKKLVLREGEKNRRLEVTLGAGGAVSSPPAPAGATPPGSGAVEGMMTIAPPVPSASPAPPPAAPPAPEPAGSSSWSGQKTFALVAGGVGVLGLVLGSVTGAQAFSKWSDAKNQCNGGCPPGGPADTTKNDAQTAATVSTAAFVVGGLGIAAGAVLWFTAPSGRSQGQLQVSPSVGPQTAGLTVRGVF